MEQFAKVLREWRIFRAQFGNTHRGRMLSKPHQSSARAPGGVLGYVRALLLSFPLAVLACCGNAHALGLSTITPPTSAAHSEAGTLPAQGAADQLPAAAAASATSAVAQSAGTIVPASASSAHSSGHTLASAAGAAVQAIAAAPEGSSAGGHAASRLLASARNSAPAASEAVPVSHAVSRTLAPVAGAVHVLQAHPLAPAQTPAQILAVALLAASPPGGGHLVAPGREAILRVLRPTTPAAAAAIQHAAEALAGGRGRSPSLPLLPPLPGLADRPIPALGALAPGLIGRTPEQSVVEALGVYLPVIALGLGPETGTGGGGAGGYEAGAAGRADAGPLGLPYGAAPPPTREAVTGTAGASRTPCTLAAGAEQITQLCGAPPLPVIRQGSRPFLAGPAVLPSRGPPLETFLGGARASARSAGAPGAPSPAPGTGGPSGSAAGALGSALPTLLLLAGLLLAGTPRLVRRLSLARQLCIAAPFALIPERPG
jgi:hypothetical protein